MVLSIFFCIIGNFVILITIQLVINQLVAGLTAG
jgi:hypothetical protein